MIIVKIIYSLFWISPVILIGYITVHANNAQADSWIVISLATVAVLITIVSAIKVAEIWGGNSKEEKK